MALNITVLESANLAVTVIDSSNIALTPVVPATITVEIGVPGAAATITVGTTTTLAAGLNATVTNVGTATNAILDFGIPQGIQGIQGIQGPKGDTGDSGVVYATSPLSYDSGTKTISIDLSAYATQSWVTSQGYITVSALAPYLTSATAAATYYPLTNPSGFVPASSLGTAAYESTSYWIQSPAVAATDGQIPAWDAATSRSVWIDNSARSLFLVGVNKTGSTIPKGSAVYVSGATGGTPEITMAQANSELASSRTIGVTTAAIANNAQGNVVVGGAATKLDTSAYSEGQILYLSATVAGGFTTTLPTQPLHGVVIGYVTRSNNSNGVIEVAIQNYQELGELSDVLISSKTNLDLLSWDSASSTWQNKSFATLGLLTSATAASTYYPLTNPAGYITSSALTPYITSATAASTYQTIAGMSAYATLASPTFTGDPKAPTPATADNDTSIATTAFVKNQGYVNSSYVAAYYYPLTNPSNFVIPNGTTSIQVTGGTFKSIDGSDNFVQLNQTALEFGNGTTVSGLYVTGSGITYADSTVQTTAGIGDAPSDGSTYGRNNGAWVIAGGGSGSGTLTYSSPYIYDTVTASNINSLDLGSGTLTSGQTIGGNATIDSSGLTLAASSGAVITFADATTQSTAPHDIPSGGTTGQVLAKNSATDYDVSWVAAGGGGSGGVDIQTFGSSTTSGTFTWTKPAGAKVVEVYLIGGGAGGGSGGRYATTSGRSGGGGGSGGAIIQARINAAFLNSTQSVVIGAGGAGGASRTTDTTSGSNGSAGGFTTFSIFQTGSAAAGGAGNTSSGGQGFPQSSSLFGMVGNNVGTGGQGRTTSGGTANSTTQTYAYALGGGGGAGAVASSTTANGGGTGGSIVGNSGAGLTINVAGGTGGQGLTSTPATAGVSATTQYFIGGTGGGGGGYRTAAGGSLLNGGAGGWPGGGGGGGGASDNGFASGAGGAGANGYAVIITYT